MTPTAPTIEVNRAPVLTLWATVVAARLGFEPDEALTLGRVVAGLNAYAKGKALGLFEPTPEATKRRREAARAGDAPTVDLMGRAVPVTVTPEGVRALSKDRPVARESVEGYLRSKFGESLGPTRQSMARLARLLPPSELARRAYDPYLAFRPSVPAGERVRGAAGELDLGPIARMATGGRRAGHA